MLVESIDDIESTSEIILDGIVGKLSGEHGDNPALLTLCTEVGVLKSSALGVSDGPFGVTSGGTVANTAFSFSSESRRCYEVLKC